MDPEPTGISRMILAYRMISQNDKPEDPEHPMVPTMLRNPILHCILNNKLTVVKINHPKSLSSEW